MNRRQTFVSSAAGANEIGTYFKFVAEIEEGIYVSIFDGRTEYRHAEMLTNEVRPGFYGLIAH